MANTAPKTITALKVNQWLPQWNKVDFDEKLWQARPQKHFYMCSIKAGHLKALTGVHRRIAKGARANDPNVQRGYEEERSHIIRDYVQYGFPWCEMSEANRKRPETSDLRKPGWLPTAILVNILKAEDVRNNHKLSKKDVIEVKDEGAVATIKLPAHFSGTQWQPEAIYPLEVIDGQHRLWAFEGFDVEDDFELPVVAFHGLDRGWQAYLFWSVNITPKKINRSLAFDLYPLLRQQTWLDKFEGHSIYRESRCQELVEALWGYPQSPWHLRINMLGERVKDRDYKGPMVSQAAWIRSLMASFVKQWEGSGTRTGGLFGAPPSANETFLPWNRAMQAAFLIHAGILFKDAITKTQATWAKAVRDLEKPSLFPKDDAAFYGDYSLISTDQGIRGVLFAVNDLCFAHSEELELNLWQWEDTLSNNKNHQKPSATDYDAIDAAISSLGKKPKIEKFLKAMMNALSTYDWRSSSAPGLSDVERRDKLVFRGSSGYKEIRHQLLLHLSKDGAEVAKAAKAVLSSLKYK